MTDDEDLDGADLRAELMQARDTLRREIEILVAPTTIGGGADNRQVLAALRDELAQIEAILANR